MSSDRIEKTVVLRASRARVWRALVDAGEFGRWFGVTFVGEFVVGAPMRGVFTEGLPEAQIAAFQKSLGLEPSPVRPPPKDAVFGIVERIEPMTRFSFRWVPYGIDAACTADEPMTLVEFFVDDVAEADGGGTRLRIVESGFDGVPAHRRERAFRMNDAGWAAQGENVRRHVESA